MIHVLQVDVDSEQKSKPAPCRIVIGATAYDSGFKTGWENARGWLYDSTIGYVIDKGIDTLIDNIPYFSFLKKETSAYDFVVEAASHYTAEQGGRLAGDQPIRIRIRSIVLVETSGKQTKVYTIEGAAEMKTEAGQKATLADRQVATISDDSRIVAVDSFDMADLGDWSKIIRRSHPPPMSPIHMLLLGD